MKADEKRFHRITLLSKIYVKSGYSDIAVVKRAIQMGVTEITANSYLTAIKERYPQWQKNYLQRYFASFEKGDY